MFEQDGSFGMKYFYTLLALMLLAIPVAGVAEVSQTAPGQQLVRQPRRKSHRRLQPQGRLPRVRPR